MHAFVVQAYQSAGRFMYWTHSKSVAEIIGNALDASGESAADPDFARDLQVAAVGHDLYEDTKVNADEVRARFGARVERLIDGGTNRSDRPDDSAYLAQLRHAEEGVRLIKAADLVDNALSAAYGIPELGVRWVRDTYLPLVEKQSEAVLSTSYTQFPGTAALLRPQLQFAMQRLRTNLEITESSGSAATIDPLPVRRGTFIDAVSKLRIARRAA